MKAPTFLEGVAVALAASLLGAASFAVLSALLPAALVLRVEIALIGLGYVIYLLRRSRERIGRITSLGVWALAAIAIWLGAPSLTTYIVGHVGLVWIVRSLYHYSSVLAALTDLGLGALGLIAALWAATVSHSVFLSLWCFFLVQALFAAIPKRLPRKPAGERRTPDHEDRFQRAHRTAEAALRKLTTSH